MYPKGRIDAKDGLDALRAARDANDRLCQAAPDLLAALQELVRAERRSNNQELMTNQQRNRIAAAERAIAKATS